VFGGNGRVRYSSGGGGDGYGSGRRRERIELGCGSISGGHDCRTVGDRAVGASVAKANAVAGNSIAVSISHPHG
jgi:hypothetical protein